MATLSKHNIIGKVAFMTKQYAVSDKGITYINYGHGWKQHGKLKPGVTPVEFLEAHNKRLADIRANVPAYEPFRNLLKSAAPATCRNQVLTALQLLCDDVDGFWSEVNDHMGYEMRDRLSLHDCEELARAYKLYVAQMKEWKSTQAV